MFEFKAKMLKTVTKPGVEDGEPDTTETVEEIVTLVFRPYGDAPGRISRHNIGRTEQQVWDYLEWGLAEPKFWPTDSKKPGHNIFDEMPQRQITKAYNAWQRAGFDDDEDDEKAGGA